MRQIRTFFLTAVLSLVCHASAWALDAFTPPGLEAFSRMNVHSIVQDRTGAMWISTTRGLYRYNGHALDHLSEELPWNCLHYDGGDAVLAATADRLLSFDIVSLDMQESGPSSYPAGHRFVCSDGAVAESLEDGGFSVDGRVYRSCGDLAISDVRGFAQGEDGTLYVGAASGLYSLGKDAVVRSESIAGTFGCPVCCMFQSSSGDIWIGTYHSGVYLASRNFPFESIDSVPRGLMINGAAETPLGVLLFSDGQGVWRLSGNGCVPMPSFGQYKFQGAYFDEAGGLIWAPVFREGLFAFDLSGRRIRVLGGAGIETLTPIARCRDDLLVGTSHGLFRFDPDREKDLVRREDGIEGLVYSLGEDGLGRIWVAGNGVYVIDGSSLRDTTALSGGNTCYGIDFTGDSVWLAFARKGLRNICQDGSSRNFTAADSGLCDDFTYGVMAIDDSSVLVNTASGVSIINTDGHVQNYPSIKADKVLKLKDGGTVLFGRDGAWRFSPGKLFAQEPGRIRIDHVFVGGRRFLGNVMSHEENNISFDATSFNYGDSSPQNYYCRLDGVDSDWTRFSLSDNLQYRSLRPGRYTFRVKACDGGMVRSEDSFSFRIRYAWYASPAAIACFSFLILGLALLVLYFVLSRRKLASALERKEEESREKTRFLIDLSLRMRTPLNLIVAKLERYFRDYGSRSAGSQNIDEIYQQSRELQKVVGEFVDTQNDSAVEPEVSGKVLYDARFYNAAIGAVERNLYSPELDIALLCREMNVGKTTLTARLKQTSGMTPHALIEDIRLKHAAQMLEDGNHRIAEIADLLCFCSSKHFCGRFRLKYGCTPNEYRKKHIK